MLEFLCSVWDCSYILTHISWIWHLQHFDKLWLNGKRPQYSLAEKISLDIHITPYVHQLWCLMLSCHFRITFNNFHLSLRKNLHNICISIRPCKKLISTDNLHTNIFLCNTSCHQVKNRRDKNTWRKSKRGNNTFKTQCHTIISYLF